MDGENENIRHPRNLQVNYLFFGGELIVNENNF